MSFPRGELIFFVFGEVTDFMFFRLVLNNRWVFEICINSHIFAYIGII